jgi:hypothetical protein
MIKRNSEQGYKNDFERFSMLTENEIFLKNNEQQKRRKGL